MTLEQYQNSIDLLDIIKDAIRASVLDNYKLTFTAEEQAIIDGLPQEVPNAIDEVLGLYQSTTQYDFRRVLVYRGMIEVWNRLDDAVKAANIGFNARAK